jgi:hypothetical protein
MKSAMVLWLVFPLMNSTPSTTRAMAAPGIIVKVNRRRPTAGRVKVSRHERGGLPAQNSPVTYWRRR